MRKMTQQAIDHFRKEYCLPEWVTDSHIEEKMQGSFPHALYGFEIAVKKFKTKLKSALPSWLIRRF